MQEKSNLGKIIDKLTLISSLLLLFLTLLSKLFKNRPLLFFSCLILSILSSHFLIALLNKLTKTKKLKKDEEKHAHNIMLTFQTASPSKLKDFWKRALEKAYKIEKTTSSGFLISTNSSKIYFCYDFSLNEINLDKILPALDKASSYNAKLYFLAKNFSSSVKELKNNNVNLFNTTGTYQICKHLKHFPKIPPQIKRSHSFSNFINMVTNKNLFKAYFKLSIIFFLLSFILPLKNYYRFFTIFTLILTIICLSKKQTQNLNNSTIFD